VRHSLTQRGLIALVQVLAMGVWFSASAVVPALATRWHLSAGAAAWLTAPVQAGFVLGAIVSAVFGLADRMPPHLLVAACAAGAAACTLVMALLVDSPAAAVPLRFATGAFLAGVYPVGMKLMASWSPPAGRALAMGALIGSLTLGSALPHLIDGLWRLNWRTLLAVAAATAFSGAIVAGALVRPGPRLPSAGGTGRPGYALRMFADSGPRLVNLAYFGHMWELYALWTWLPTFLAASSTDTTGLPASASPGASGIDAFLTIGVAGLAGCLIGGWAADRAGRAATAGTALAVSGACCLLSPLSFEAGRPWLLAFATVWGAAVIADSGVFSTLLSETADRGYIGTALTTQTAIGFLLTIVTIQGIPLIAAVVGWRYAFLALAAGPMTALPAITALRRHLRNPHTTHSPPPKGITMNSCWPSGPPAVGDTAELSRAVAPEDIERFTQISGDRNPLHYDPAAARASRFGEIVVQGGVTTAILNAVVAESLPGPGTVFLNVNWDFKAPVRPGDVITGHVEILEARTDKPITKLRTSVVRGDGTVALEGTAVCYTMAITPAQPHDSGTAGAPANYK
jgi:acyl dehydratase/predicted MFS family arabinose efflux permease